MRKVAAKAVKFIPGALRRRVRARYQNTPIFAGSRFFGICGEDAFLQKYFYDKLARTSDNAKLPVFLQKRVGPGFYVDIGALAPVRYSNTFWFYQHGWRGINVDAEPGSMTDFRSLRPRDVNLEALVSDADAEIPFFHWGASSGLSTTNAQYAATLSTELGAPRRTVMRSRSLAGILDEHLPRGQEISFLTVDVEGHDLPVLRSNNWSRYRPELVLVEAMDANTVDRLTTSDVHQFMRQQGYYLYAWLHPTLVFQREGVPDWIVPGSSPTKAQA
jgi:FkbM family methyltransferase